MASRDVHPVWRGRAGGHSRSSGAPGEPWALPHLTLGPLSLRSPSPRDCCLCRPPRKAQRRPAFSEATLWKREEGAQPRASSLDRQRRGLAGLGSAGHRPVRRSPTFQKQGAEDAEKGPPVKGPVPGRTSYSQTLGNSVKSEKLACATPTLGAICLPNIRKQRPGSPCPAGVCGPGAVNQAIPEASTAIDECAGNHSSVLSKERWARPPPCHPLLFSLL